ncbi:Armadillo repeat only 4-like protein [Gossypium australe]|uniref:Armadillo repeat only 4-like protein n=1 Tax=Gossypium australe TaxID=47621 RepID=A0A5B6WK12_9ROSI|nr:Armadillo repeat only 4-like protein [Gossypium australe]
MASKWGRKLVSLGNRKFTRDKHTRTTGQADDNFRRIVRNQKYQNLFCGLFTSSITTDFQKFFHILDASITDMEWVVSLYEPQNRGRSCWTTANRMSPTVFLWSCIANVEMGSSLDDRIEACDHSLMKLLKEYCPLVAHIAAVNKLCLLANEDSEGTIMKEMISTFIKSLSKTSPISKQTQAADLVASIAERNPELKQHNLIRENIIWQLVILLSSEQSTLELKISCSKALWKLAQGSFSNCQTFNGDERNAMLSQGITSIAESDDDFRRLAFTSSSPDAKAVVDELLRSRVIGPLVSRLGNTDQDVAMEAAIALKKFVSTDNYLSSEHSKSIIEFEGVPLLTELLNSGDKNTHPHILALICYLAQHDSNSNVLIKADLLTALQTIAPKVNREYTELETLVPHTISKLQFNLTVEQQQTEILGVVVATICEAFKTGSPESKATEFYLQLPLMALMEITALAEHNIDLRSQVFKIGSPESKDTVEPLLRVIKESEDYKLKVLAIKSIGSLARIFRKSNHHPVISLLVSQLENGRGKVVMEALVALEKFSCDENYLCKEHSNKMIEFNAAQILVKLLSDGESELKLQVHGLVVLMCCIASKGDYCKAVEEARMTTAVRQLLREEGELGTFVSQKPELKELATKALHSLILYYEY